MFKNIIKLIPFSIAVILVLTHLIQVLSYPGVEVSNGETMSRQMIDSVVFASIGLMITMILILLKKRLWKIVFLGLVLLSFTSFINFYSHTYSLIIGPVSIEMTALALLLFHLILNPEIIPEIKFNSEHSGEVSQDREVQMSKHFEQSVKRFERKFEAKQKIELEKIVNEDVFVPEAIEAAQRLLIKKY